MTDSPRGGPEGAAGGELRPDIGGALLAAVWATITWTSSGLRRDLRGLLDPGVPWTRSARRGHDARDLRSGAGTVPGRAPARGNPGIRAIVFLLTGLTLVALPAWVAFRAEERAVDEVAEVGARSAEITTEEAIARVRTDPDLAVRTDSRGVWPSIVAGVLVRWAA
jgi:RES domain-containing protein